MGACGFESRPRHLGKDRTAPYLHVQLGPGLFQVTHERDCHAALADRRGDALHWPKPHVAGIAVSRR